jgi:hypothetical protein
VQLTSNGDPYAIGVNIPLVDRTEINGATDVVPGTHKLSPLLGYGGRQPNRPENEPDYNKLLIQVLTPTLPTLIQRSSLCHLDITSIAQMHRLIDREAFMTP